MSHHQYETGTPFYIKTPLYACIFFMMHAINSAIRTLNSLSNQYQDLDNIIYVITFIFISIYFYTYYLKVKAAYRIGIFYNDMEIQAPCLIAGIICAIRTALIVYDDIPRLNSNLMNDFYLASHMLSWLAVTIFFFAYYRRLRKLEQTNKDLLE